MQRIGFIARNLSQVAGGFVRVLMSNLLLLRAEQMDQQVNGHKQTGQGDKAPIHF